MPIVSERLRSSSPPDTQETIRLANVSEAGLLLAAFLLAAAVSMLPTTRTLLTLWRTDPLRSFGGLLPFVSLMLTLRTWHRLRWSFAPHPAGIALILAAVCASRLSEGFQLSYRIGSLSLDPMQPALLLFLFFSGVVLLLGGTLLWKRSLAALCLLLCANPVPHLFTTWVDFPLQRLSAGVARNFAHVLGLYPTGQQLQLMFTPRFGMQIIPGCNGMRGAATMAYGAMVLAYLRGYRPRTIALLAVAAAALGYLLNFLRLCLLVVYYAVGRNHPSLRGDGAMVDYIIGGCLFLAVSTLAGAIWTGGIRPDLQEPEQPVAWPDLLRRPLLQASVLLLGVAALTEAPAAYALAQTTNAAVTPLLAFQAMPLSAGPWVRSTTYQQEDLDGIPRWVWATYRAQDGRSVDLGIWLMPFQHFSLKSRQVHGVEPEWTGQRHFRAANGIPVAMSNFVARDDVGTDGSQIGYFAETTCLAARCSSHVAGFRKQGWSAAVGPAALRTTVRLPLQFRILHTTESSLSPQDRARDEAMIGDLLSRIDTAALTRELGFR